MFKVCDEPHPLLIKDMLTHCSKGDMDPAYKIARHLWNLGYSAEDIITNVFRVCKTHNELPEYLKLEFIKEIGYTHLLIAQGTRSLLQLAALLARLCQLVEPSSSSWNMKKRCESINSLFFSSTDSWDKSFSSSKKSYKSRLCVSAGMLWNINFVVHVNKVKVS